MHFVFLPTTFIEAAILVEEFALSVAHTIKFLTFVPGAVGVVFNDEFRDMLL